jgi:hypothetical protein
MPRSGYVHAARQPLKTMIMFSAVHLRRAPATYIRSSIEQTTSPAGPVLWEGLAHWLNHPNEPLSIDTSRYSGDTQLLVQQALREQERIGWGEDRSGKDDAV